MAVAKPMITEVFSLGQLFLRRPSVFQNLMSPSGVFNLSSSTGHHFLCHSLPHVNGSWQVSLTCIKTSVHQGSLVPVQRNIHELIPDLRWDPLGNLAGRIGWAAVSDKVGRRNIYLLFTTAGEQLDSSSSISVTRCGKLCKPALADWWRCLSIHLPSRPHPACHLLRQHHLCHQVRHPQHYQHYPQHTLFNLDNLWPASWEVCWQRFQHMSPTSLDLAMLVLFIAGLKSHHQDILVFSLS